LPGIYAPETDPVSVKCSSLVFYGSLWEFEWNMAFKPDLNFERLMKFDLVILVSVTGMKITRFTSIFWSESFITASACGVSRYLKTWVAVSWLGLERKY
jgi:hypothetical protein